jgi:hypothetical protein
MDRLETVGNKGVSCLGVDGVGGMVSRGLADAISRSSDTGALPLTSRLHSSTIGKSRPTGVPDSAHAASTSLCNNACKHSPQFFHATV